MDYASGQYEAVVRLGLGKFATQTQFRTHTIQDVRPYGDAGLTQAFGVSDEPVDTGAKTILYLLQHPEKGQIAHTVLEPRSDTAALVAAMRVEPEFQGQGYGKQLWQSVQEALPKGVDVFALPEPYKEGNKSVEDLGGVYESYGFQPMKGSKLYRLPYALRPEATEKTAEHALKKLGFTPTKYRFGYTPGQVAGAYKAKGALPRYKQLLMGERLAPLKHTSSSMALEAEGLAKELADFGPGSVPDYIRPDMDREFRAMIKARDNVAKIRNVERLKSLGTQALTAGGGVAGVAALRGE